MDLVLGQIKQTITVILIVIKYRCSNTLKARQFKLWIPQHFPCPNNFLISNGEAQQSVWKYSCRNTTRSPGHKVSKRLIRFNFEDFKQIASNEFQGLVNKLELPTKLDQMTGLEEGKVPLDPFQIALAHRYKIKQDELSANSELLEKVIGINPGNYSERRTEKKIGSENGRAEIFNGFHWRTEGKSFIVINRNIRRLFITGNQSVKIWCSS